MKTIKEIIPLTAYPQTPGCQAGLLSAIPEDALFLDIETTGFSSQKETVYLVGCCHRQGDAFVFRQWFAETPAEEPAVLAATADALRHFPAVVTFNGDTFDLPFLRNRADLCGCSGNAFFVPRSLDLLKTVRPLRHLLRLPDCRQKTVEAFFGLLREDRYSGGELISCYREYCKEPEETLLHLLLLHNREDVLAMPLLSGLFSYKKLLERDFSVCRETARERSAAPDAPAADFSVTLQLDLCLPQPVWVEEDGISIRFTKDLARICAPVYAGELRYFFSDYKNYYYLPAEDMAVHKSVAAFVDKDFRRKASLETAYQRKSGEFFRIPRQMHYSPVFRSSFGEPPYMLLADCPSDADFWTAYLHGALPAAQSARLSSTSSDRKGRSM